MELCEERIQILGNQKAVYRLVQNILKNVLEHGSKEVHIRLKSENGRVGLICENQVEQPEAIDITQVFARFYKSDPARTHSSTGLGLAIAKGLAERMEGTMTAEIVADRFRVSVWFKVIS